MNSEFDQKLQTQIAKLQKEQSPERDLWPGIEMAVMTSRYRQTPWMAVAASVLACALGGWILFGKYYQTKNQSADVIEQIDALHQQQISALKVAFKNTQSLTSNWSEQLQDMDHAADAIKQALRNDPHNVTLLKMLSDVYQKEIDLLKTVHEPNLQNSGLI